MPLNVIGLLALDFMGIYLQSFAAINSQQFGSTDQMNESVAFQKYTSHHRFSETQIPESGFNGVFHRSSVRALSIFLNLIICLNNH